MQGGGLHRKQLLARTYLDVDERKRFAQSSHEYLIEQVQEGTLTAGAASSELNFNHPVKELIWVVQDNTLTSEDPALTANDCDATLNVNASGGGTVSKKHDYFNYITSNGTDEVMYGIASNEPFSTMKLQLNGHDRFSARNASYFRTCQPIQAGHKVPSKHVYCYSFALKPEEHQPSGTCNFSRIDNAQLVGSLSLIHI